MKIQKSVQALQKLGQMPDHNDKDIPTSMELSGKYDTLLESVELPINYNEAEILVQLFPNESLYEVEWPLLHLFETVYEQITETEHLQLIEKCPSKEWRNTLSGRFENWRQKQVSAQINGNEEKIRIELEPKMEIAKKIYPEILKMILEYTEYCDKNGDEDSAEYKKLEDRLHKLTGKDMSKYNLWEWWEEEGAEVLAFKIALPSAEKIENITRKELLEIIKKTDNFKPENADEFTLEFVYHLSDWYHDLLEKNFKNYNANYFHRQKDKNGSYFEYTKEEIADKILGITETSELKD